MKSEKTKAFLGLIVILSRLVIIACQVGLLVQEGKYKWCLIFRKK